MKICSKSSFEAFYNGSYTLHSIFLHKSLQINVNSRHLLMLEGFLCKLITSQTETTQLLLTFHLSQTPSTFEKKIETIGSSTKKCMRWNDDNSKDIENAGHSLFMFPVCWFGVANWKTQKSNLLFSSIFSLNRIKRSKILFIPPFQPLSRPPVRPQTWGQGSRLPREQFPRDRGHEEGSLHLGT